MNKPVKKRKFYDVSLAHIMKESYLSEVNLEIKVSSESSSPKCTKLSEENKDEKLFGKMKDTGYCLGDVILSTDEIWNADS